MSAFPHRPRRRKTKFVAVTCHYDIAEWLCPDWIYEPHTNSFSTVRLRRPAIELEIRRVDKAAWQFFKAHHYLSASLSPTAVCFVAFWREQPVCFSSVIVYPNSKRRCVDCREHRTVCLPDFQGVGIGNAVADYVAGLFKVKGNYFSTTANPQFIRKRNADKHWQMQSKHKLNVGNKKTRASLSLKLASNRYTCSFKFIGKSNPEDARAFGI